MPKFYSPSTNGFYSDDINPVLPSDAVGISDTQWLECLRLQGLGLQLIAGPDGIPITVRRAAAELAPAATKASGQGNAGLSFDDCL